MRLYVPKKYSVPVKVRFVLNVNNNMADEEFLFTFSLTAVTNEKLGLGTETLCEFLSSEYL